MQTNLSLNQKVALPYISSLIHRLPCKGLPTVVGVICTEVMAMHRSTAYSMVYFFNVDTHVPFDETFPCT